LTGLVAEVLVGLIVAVGVLVGGTVGGAVVGVIIGIAGMISCCNRDKTVDVGAVTDGFVGGVLQ